jgi:hypothetical protein
MEKKFLLYVEHKIHEPTESENSSESDSDTGILGSRTFLQNALSRTGSGKQREKLEKQWRKSLAIRSVMIEDPQKKISQLLDFFNDITTETAQLIEVKDIIDELKPIVEIQQKQVEVFDKVCKALDSWLTREGNSYDLEHQPIREAERQMRQFATRFSYQFSEIEALAEKAKNTHTTVRDFEILIVR